MSLFVLCRLRSKGCSGALARGRDASDVQGSQGRGLNSCPAALSMAEAGRPLGPEPMSLLLGHPLGRQGCSPHLCVVVFGGAVSISSRLSLSFRKYTDAEKRSQRRKKVSTF